MRKGKANMVVQSTCSIFHIPFHFFLNKEKMIVFEYTSNYSTLRVIVT